MQSRQRSMKTNESFRAQNPMSEPEVTIQEPHRGAFRVTARLLRRFIPGEMRGLALGLFFLLVASAMALLQPWPIKVVLDSVVGKITPAAVVHWLLAPFENASWFAGHPGLLLLTILCIAILLIELLVGACHVLSTYVLNSVALRMVFRLRCALFD